MLAPFLSPVRRLSALALGAVIATAPLAALAQVNPPKPVALCADLALSVEQLPIGRDMVRVFLRVTNAGPGAYEGKRGEQWLEHVVTVKGAEVERKKHALVTLGAGQTTEVSFTRSKADCDFGVAALIQFKAGLDKDQNLANDDCNAANNAGLATVQF